MKITEALLGEHGVLYAQFDHLEQAVPRADSLAWLKAQGALLKAAVETHAQIEEELLFKTLEPHLGGGGPLAVMRMEHSEIEGGLSTLPDAEDVETAGHLLLRVVQVARQHFAKEEQVLFPMAEQVLGPERLADLGEQWAEWRKVSVRV
ncbi:MAG TPA: hemerythrin domain-containing protein [Anaerolineales bacterium]|nr:hemerythrin domain-containing protein [Anaerolineales bacterium]